MKGYERYRIVKTVMYFSEIGEQAESKAGYRPEWSKGGGGRFIGNSPFPPQRAVARLVLLLYLGFPINLIQNRQKNTKKNEIHHKNDRNSTNYFCSNLV